MKIKGFDVTRAKHLGFRQTKEGDLDPKGQQMGMHETAFVYLKDCRIFEKDGHKYYDASEAPAIPTANGGSYYGYGEARKAKKYRWFQGRLYFEYWTRPVYFARDGRVYTGTSYLFEPPSDLPLQIEVGTAKNIISLLEHVLPHLKEEQSAETIVGRVQHAEAIIQHLQENIKALQPQSMSKEELDEERKNEQIRISQE